MANTFVEDQQLSNTDSSVNKESRKGRFQEIFAEKGAVLPSVMIFLVQLGIAGLLTYLPIFAETFGIVNIGLFFTVQALTLALSRLFIGKLSKLLGHTITITFSIIFISISLLGIYFSRTLPPLLFCAVLVGLGSGAINPELLSIAIKRTSIARRGSTNSFFQMAHEGGVCISTLILGIIATQAGIQWVFLLSSFTPVFSLIVYFTMLRSKLIREKI